MAKKSFKTITLHLYEHKNKHVQAQKALYEHCYATGETITEYILNLILRDKENKEISKN